MPRLLPPDLISPDTQSAPGVQIGPRLVSWQRHAGRHDLPWQVRDAYRVWLSEIMLQQTQVSTVIPYFHAFLTRFPDVARLAAASQEEVLEAWSGLGYYSRARNLHRCAQVVLERHAGQFPADMDALIELPGIGRSTAAAISVFCHGQRQAILDGNVKRVLSRVFAIAGTTNNANTEKELWSIACQQVPIQDIEAYTQGLMDLGASLCGPKRTACDACPLEDICQARAWGLQGILPTPKPRKTIPKRNATFALIVQDNAVLLEPQPSPGLWGGLLCMPRQDEKFGEKLASMGFAQGALEMAGGFEHVFTHFKLFAQVSAVHLTPRASLFEPAAKNATVIEHDAALRWVPIEKLAGAALPQPIKKYLLEKFRPPGPILVQRSLKAHPVA